VPLLFVDVGLNALALMQLLLAEFSSLVVEQQTPDQERLIVSIRISLVAVLATHTSLDDITTPGQQRRK